MMTLQHLEGYNMNIGLYTVERDSSSLQKQGVILGGVDYESGTGTIAKIDNQDLLFNDLNITTELPALDATIVKESFVKYKDIYMLAGQQIKFSWNYFGALELKLIVDDKRYAIKGTTLKAVLKKIYEYHFHKEFESKVDDKWNIIHGQLLIGKNPRIKVLWRGETLIGIYKESTNVAKTIKWYEQAIYKGKAIQFNRIHKTVDFRAETVHEVYDTLAPEFTKENELEEIREFITSLKRRLSNEEIEILVDTRSELDNILGDNIESKTDEELLEECRSRGLL